MELDELRALVAVADTRSINAAAARLHLTQPAVSRQVQRLETSLGVRLLDRRTKPVSLTPAGEAVLEHARNVLRAIDDLRDVAADATGPAGELSVGVSQTLADATLARPISHLRRTFPHIRLFVSTGWSHELAADVRRARLDAAIVLLPDAHDPPAGLVGTRIGTERLLAVAARRSGIPATIDLRTAAEHPWVLNPRGCVFRAELERAFHRIGADLRVAVEIYGTELQLSLVARGHGLGLVPARVLARTRSPSGLRTVRIRGADLRVAVWMVAGRVPDRFQPVLRMLQGMLAAGYEAADSGASRRPRPRPRQYAGRAILE